MVEVLSMRLEDRVAAIRERIAAAALRAGRSPAGVLLVGVTKTRTVSEMRDIAPFIDAIGENRVQEAAEKREEGPGMVEWRLIGHLQGNKARKAVELFDAVDSLDSIPLAERLDRVAEEAGRVFPVLIEVNTAQESSKTGTSPEDFPGLVDRVLALPHLALEGFRISRIASHSSLWVSFVEK